MARLTLDADLDAGRQTGGRVRRLKGIGKRVREAVWGVASLRLSVTSPGEPGRNNAALIALFGHHADGVERVLTRILGPDPEVPDLVQEVFVRALRSIDQFSGETAVLRPWLTTIAVYTARAHIRHKRSRPWLRRSTREPMPELTAATASPETTVALRRVRAVLDKLPADERIPFTLRFLDDMELDEVAGACQVSLATVKRRLTRARERFERLAARDPLLGAYVPKERA